MGHRIEAPFAPSVITSHATFDVVEYCSGMEDDHLAIFHSCLTTDLLLLVLLRVLLQDLVRLRCLSIQRCLNAVYLQLTK